MKVDLGRVEGINQNIMDGKTFFFQNLAKEGQKFGKALLLFSKCLLDDSCYIEVIVCGQEELCFLLFLIQVVCFVSLGSFAGPWQVFKFVRVFQ